MLYHLKNRGSALRDWNINIKLNHKISVVIHNLINYDSHLIMREVGKKAKKILSLSIYEWFWKV